MDGERVIILLGNGFINDFRNPGGGNGIVKDVLQGKVIPFKTGVRFSANITDRIAGKGCDVQTFSIIQYTGVGKHYIYGSLLQQSVEGCLELADLVHTKEVKMKKILSEDLLHL
jgi:hypothetical protein